MPKRAGHVDERAVLDALRRAREAMVRLQSAYHPRSGISREARHLMEDIDTLACLITGDKAFFVTKPH